MSAVRNIVIDNRLEQYASFLDYAWVQQIHDVGRGTELEKIIRNLTLAWKGAAHVHRMPWLMMNQLKSILEGYANQSEPMPMKMVAHLANSLTRHDPSLTKKQRNHLKNLLVQIDKEVRKELPNHPANFDKEICAYWEDMLKSPDFAVTLWKSAQTVYAAIYYGYEDFVAACTGLVRNSPNYRIPRPKEFARDFVEVFGNDLYEKCWSDQRIQLTRLVRNAIVHNGGRITEELMSQERKLRIEDGQIVIMAHLCTSLFGFLKYCALALAIATESIVQNQTEQKFN